MLVRAIGKYLPRRYYYFLCKCDGKKWEIVYSALVCRRELREPREREALMVVVVFGGKNHPLRRRRCAIKFQL
jgi:hypothetical protein